MPADGNEEEVKAGWEQPHPRMLQKVVEFYREVNTHDIVKKTDMFKSMEFYIVNVDDKVANKAFLESRIVENGGTRV